MKLRLSTLTPFLLGALVRGQVQVQRDPQLSSKDLAAIPRPDAQLQMVPCEGALKESFDSFLADWPEKQYQEAEYAERCSYFHYSLQYVTLKAADATKGFDVALNEFADFSPKELANIGGALPVVTNPKPAPMPALTLGATDPLPTAGAGATNAAATGSDTTTTTPETKEAAAPSATSPIPTAQDSVAGIAAAGDGQATTAGPISTDGGNAPSNGRRQARKDRRVERRRAARRRDLEGEEPQAPAPVAADPVASPPAAPATNEGGEATTATEKLVDGAAAATTGAVETATDTVDATVTVAKEAVTDAAAALWDLSAFVGEAADALAAEAPALDIDALRTPPADGDESFTTMALGGSTSTAPKPVTVDRHGVNPPATIAAVTRLTAPLPETLDYSTADNPYAVEAMGNVKDTGKCGASWALTAAALAESRVALDSGVSPSEDLSAQELLDCTDPGFGCGGGRIERALTYISNNGLAYEGEAEAEDTWVEGHAPGMCKIDPEAEREYLGVISQINPCNQRDLMRALVYLGPVAAHVKSSCRAFLFYAGGILDDEECFAMPFAKPSTCASAVDHNVLIVGYGSDVDTDTDYWIVKGNYGDQWGEDGYAKIKMATRGLCGNGCLAAFPLTVVPRSFGIDAQGAPAYDGSAPSILSVYTEEAAVAADADGTDGVAPVDPNTILPGPLPQQKGSGLVPPSSGHTSAPPATTDPVSAPPAPESAKANASSAEEEAAKKRRRVVGGAVGGAFAGVFVLVAAFAVGKELQRRREEMGGSEEVPERPHLDVL